MQLQAFQTTHSARRARYLGYNPLIKCCPLQLHRFTPDAGRFRQHPDSTWIIYQEPGEGGKDELEQIFREAAQDALSWLGVVLKVRDAGADRVAGGEID